MVLMSKIDGKVRVYRNVTHKTFHLFETGFLLMRNYSKYGELYQLKGTERKLVRKFGKK